ncbi:MAG: radical SAM-associated putative lipoprotein [Alistipes sp.]|nr:radical SAM-associated putative lipoprotein [Alistipes sp.]
MKRLIYFLITALGFGAMFGCEGIDSPVPEYGAPYTEFKVKARVVDPEGNPIKGIEVSISGDFWFDNENLTLLTTETNSEGELKESEFADYVSNGLLTMRVKDIDQEENGGEFVDKIIELNEYITEDSKIEEGSGWSRGRYEINVGDIELRHWDHTTDGDPIID